MSFFVPHAQTSKTWGSVDTGATRLQNPPKCSSESVESRKTIDLPIPALFGAQKCRCVEKTGFSANPVFHDFRARRPHATQSPPPGGVTKSRQSRKIRLGHRPGHALKVPRAVVPYPQPMGHTGRNPSASSFFRCPSCATNPPDPTHAQTKIN